MAEALPIYELESQIVDTLQPGSRLLLQAPTGSGKSTQVPQMLLRAGLLDQGAAVILQPRRLATRVLAQRVAQEVGCSLGQGVGYQIRLDNVSGRDTRIKYVTEGVLLRQLVGDPRLTGISTLIFDEFHERHLYGDISLARALALQTGERPDLRVVVMSATLDRTRLQPYLQPCTVLESTGRMFPVSAEFSDRRTDPNAIPVWDQAAQAFERYVRSGAEGNVLIFMPGGYEIRRTLEALEHVRESRGYTLLPLHGELPNADQDLAVAPSATPKVVVATNVAETSLTIQGVRCVIDSGLARVARYDPRRGINTLFIERISQAAAEQRKGRAGRTGPGVCLRLWTEREHAARPLQETPEIHRVDLAEAILSLKAAGITDVRGFPWLEPPGRESVENAESLLTDLGALDRQGEITEIGRALLAFPLHPRYGRMLLAAAEFGCASEACTVAALTQGRDLLVRNPGKAVVQAREKRFGGDPSSDFRMLMEAWSFAMENRFDVPTCRQFGIHAQAARQVAPLRTQFLNIAEKEGLLSRSRRDLDVALRKSILIGFSDRVAKRRDNGTLQCDLVHARRGSLSRESVVQESDLLVAVEIHEIERKGNTVETVLSLATAVRPEWLRELYPNDFQSCTSVFYDTSTKRVGAQQEELFRDLVVSARRLDSPPLDQAAAILAEEVLEGRLTLKQWNHGVEQWILRLNRLCQWCPELDLPPITEADRRHLIEQICHGGVSYRDIKDRPVRRFVEDWLSPQQGEWLAKHVPERILLANGKTPKITYPMDGDPFIALRIQELFGQMETPKIAMNRVAVLVHLLAPNMRAVQITKDLAGFWQEHYPKVKKELQRRYPKHEWR